jgi:hypothetical protein
MKNDKNPPQTDPEPEYLMVPEFFPGLTGRHVPALKPTENKPEITRQFTDSEMLQIAKIRSERRLRRREPWYARAWSSFQNLLASFTKK